MIVKYFINIIKTFIVAHRSAVLCVSNQNLRFQMASCSPENVANEEIPSKVEDLKVQSPEQIPNQTEEESPDRVTDSSDMACATDYGTLLQPKGIDIAKYILQKEHWPKEGKHILAQYDEKTVIVYQAFKPSIAKFAVQNQKFGGPEFSYERMSWIKTNFLWMTYRCGWASKKNQERVLAVRLSRYGFEVILANAYTVKLQKELKLDTKDIEIRLQWDPDHTPTYDKVPRKAIQLGLKGEMLRTYGNEWIVSITDITDYVKSQKKILDREGQRELMTPRERVYQVLNCNTAARIELDIYDNEPVFTQRREIAVFNLDDNVTDKHLTETFKAFGPLQDVRVIFNTETGKSRGYGFVSFKNIEDASQARASLDGSHIAGKKVRVTYADPRKTDGDFEAGNNSVAQKSLQKQITLSKKVYITGLSPKVDFTHLREIFSKYGPLEGVNIIHDKMTGKCKGYAFIEYKTIEDAVKAKESLDGGVIDGKSIKVQFSNPQNTASGDKQENKQSTMPGRWTCKISDCGNENFPTRKRCSRCNTPRYVDIEDKSTGKGQMEKCGLIVMEDSSALIFGTFSKNKDTDDSGYKIPERLQVPAGMIIPRNNDEHAIIAKTATFVAAHGFEMELRIKERQGGNPKFKFMQLDHPLNYYYNHMVKMIKAGKYTPEHSDNDSHDDEGDKSTQKNS